jgi:hypothetical protein
MISAIQQAGRELKVPTERLIELLRSTFSTDRVVGYYISRTSSAEIPDTKIDVIAFAADGWVGTASIVGDLAAGGAYRVSSAVGLSIHEKGDLVTLYLFALAGAAFGGPTIVVAERRENANEFLGFIKRLRKFLSDLP